LIDFLREFLAFLGQRKKYWMLPVLIVLLVIGLLLVLAQGSVLAPFIYTLF
jgi:competence protein ComGC